MKYEYDTVQMPPHIKAEKGRGDSAAADYLKQIINAKAKDGWEFKNIETFSVTEAKGCNPFEKEPPRLSYYVIIFIREAR